MSRSCWLSTHSCHYEGWRCFVGWTVKTTKLVCLTQRLGQKREFEISPAEARNHRRSRCWDLSGFEEATLALLVLVVCSGSLYSFGLGRWHNAGHRNHRVIGGRPSVTPLGESGRIDRRSVHGRSWVVARTNVVVVRGEMFW